MAELPNTPTTGKTFKEHYVPLEERESQHIKPNEFIKDWAIIIGLTAVGAVAGRFIGKWLEPSNIKLGKLSQWMYGTDKLDRSVGMWAGIKIGGIYGVFNHWRKTEGHRMGIQNVSQDLKTALDPDQLEKETKKEEAFLTDLKTLETKMAKPVSYTESVTTRREQKQTDISLNS